MNYPDGKKVRMGDVLELWGNCAGKVVCSIDDDEYPDEETKCNWQYLESGILVDTSEAGLIHLLEAEDSFRLVRRSSLKGRR